MFSVLGGISFRDCVPSYYLSFVCGHGVIIIMYVQQLQYLTILVNTRKLGNKAKKIS